MKKIGCISLVLWLGMFCNAQGQWDKALPLGIFSYDKKAPLQLRDSLIKDEEGIKHYRISFSSIQNSRATGILFVPQGKGPFAGIVLAHGMPNTALGYTSRATYLARHGAVVVVLDAPFARRKGPTLALTPQDSVEQVQLIIDLQRAVDLLVDRSEVDPNRIAFVGRSFGGLIGTQLTAVERRIKTYILSVCDGGEIIHYSGGEWFQSHSADKQKRWVKAMEPIEPIRYIHLASPAKLFFQFGLKDQSVSVENARMLYEAAPQPKTVKWYEADHELNPQAYMDWLDWLHKTVGTTPVGPQDRQGPKLLWPKL